MSDIAISVEGLGKAYHIGLKEEIPDSLVSAISSWITAPLRNFKSLSKLDTVKATFGEAEDVFWALQDVSFEVKRGEVVGIIGNNGAGKSTLLKILSRITEPTTGRAVIRGRVSSLLEVGTGFHPELTGRENVYMNGTILGMTKREIDRKFDEIVAFSNVEKFLDTPVKRYSSGMKVRLAFAVAAHLEPEILIIDEVLAVGDTAFQKKCLGKMEDVSKSGRTVLFVSHNMVAVEMLCSSAFLVNKGTISPKMKAQDAVAKYLQSASPVGEVLQLERSLSKTKKPLLSAFSMLVEGVESSIIGVGAGLRFKVTLENIEDYADIVCSLAFKNAMGQRIVMFHTKFHSMLKVPQGKQACLVCSIPSLTLNAGEYTVEIGIADRFAGMLERIDSVIKLEVQPKDYFGTGLLPDRNQGQVVLAATWEVCGNHTVQGTKET